MLDVILPVFGLILIGYVAGKTPVMRPPAVAGLSNYVLYAAIPSLLFRTLSRTNLSEALDPGAIAAYFGGGLAVMALAFLTARRALGLKGDAAGVFAMGGIYGNTVMMGIPLVFTLYGERGLLVFSNCMVLNSPLFIPLTTLLVVASRASAGGKDGVSPVAAALASVRETVGALVRNPIMIAMALGLTASMLGFRPPKPVDRVMEMLAATAIPAALFALGAGQAGMDVRGDWREIAGMSAFKLLLHPLAVWLIAAHALALPADVTGVLVLLAAMPVGINVYLLARQYDCGVAPSGAAMIVSTALSLGTVGALIALLPAAR